MSNDDGGNYLVLPKFINNCWFDILGFYETANQPQMFKIKYFTFENLYWKIKKTKMTHSVGHM